VGAPGDGEGRAGSRCLNSRIAYRSSSIRAASRQAPQPGNRNGLCSLHRSEVPNAATPSAARNNSVASFVSFVPFVSTGFILGAAIPRRISFIRLRSHRPSFVSFARIVDNSPRFSGLCSVERLNAELQIRVGWRRTAPRRGRLCASICLATSRRSHRRRASESAAPAQARLSAGPPRPPSSRSGYTPRCHC
jgi:hypothetical protein